MRYGRPVRSFLGFLATASAIVGPALAAARMVRPIVGFGLFALGGLLALLVGLSSLVQLVRGRGLTAGGALAVIVGMVFVAIASRGAGHPRINDFTTDPADPPRFEFAETLPENEGRNMDYPSVYAVVQHECCADLRPAKVAKPVADAYDQALRVVVATPDWRATRADAAAHEIEAVATSRLFGFQDDIVIRVRPDPDGGSRIDMRSKSRDGQGDLGVNANRIRDYVKRVEAER
jgi:uncharacterized protein (DUF1499 family)